MQQDSVKYDSLANRPLPKWLTDQKDGVTLIQPKKIVMRDDHYLSTSFIATGAFILLTVAILSVIILRKYRKKT